MAILEKIQKVQLALNAPKGQRNTFGKYNYRSCEDILTAVKPLLANNGLTLKLSDEMVQLGDRYYLKATATIYDIKDNTTFENTAYARESLTKKGMDDSQITGTASSYARKYALNGLLCIDDTKDADTDAYAKRTGNVPVTDELLGKLQEAKLLAEVSDSDYLAVLKKSCKVDSDKKLTVAQAESLLERLNKKREN